MFRVLSNQHYPHCTNQKQNRRVCGQAFPSFSSLSPVIHFFFLLLSQHSRRTREETLATQASTTVFCKLELHVLRLRKEKETGTPHLFVASLLGTLHGFFLFLVTVPEVFAKANPAEFPVLFLKWQMHYSIKYDSKWILLGSISQIQKYDYSGLWTLSLEQNLWCTSSNFVFQIRVMVWPWNVFGIVSLLSF